MKVDMTQPLVDFDGIQLGYQGIPLTLQKAILVGLGNGIGEGADGEGKIAMYELGARIKRHTGKIELSDEDISLIKQAVDRSFSSPLVVAQVWAALDGRGFPKAVDEEAA